MIKNITNTSIEISFCALALLFVPLAYGQNSQNDVAQAVGVGPIKSGFGSSGVGASANPSNYPKALSPVTSPPREVPIGRLHPKVTKRLKANPLSTPSNNIGLFKDNSLPQKAPTTNTPTTNTPTQSTNFSGITNTGWYPPDTALAVGPNQIVEMVNSSWRSFNKSGATVIGQVALCGSGGWWTSVLPGGVTFCFDPKVLYDQHSGRFVMVALAIDTATNKSWYLLATSKTNDPSGSWCTWSLDAAMDGSTPTTNWADYPELGVDNQAIYITSNQFSFSTDSFQYAKVRILGKNQLYNNSCGGLSWHDVWWSSVSPFAVQPAHTYGNPGVEYLISSAPGGGTSVQLWSLTNPLTAPSLTSQNVTVASYSSPPNAVTKGSTTAIDTGDSRILNAVYRNGVLYAVHTTGCFSGAGSCFKALGINPSGPTVTVDATYGAGTGWFYYYPAIMVDGFDNLHVLFNRSSSTEYLGVRITGKQAASSTWDTSSVVKGGSASYTKLDKFGRNRAGDYSGIALDPSDSSVVWGAGEWISGTNTWSTWIAKVTYMKVIHDFNPHDFNADGKSDILWRNMTTGETVIWLMNGLGIQGGGSLGMVSLAYSIAGVGDFNADGKSDILWRNMTTGETVIWLMNGLGILSGGSVGIVPMAYSIAGVGDFNADGKSDILWHNAINGDTVVWLMNGLGVQTGGSLGMVSTVYSVAGVGDFNADGKSDILWHNAINGDTVVWLMNGLGVQTGGSLGMVSTVYSVAGAGDFNGDGKSDILWRNTTNGDTVIWLMNGLATQGGGSLGLVSTVYVISGVGDYNADVKSDILWRNTTTGDVVIWLMNGLGIQGGGSLGAVSTIWSIKE